MKPVFAYPCEGLITSIILKKDYAINSKLTKKDIVMNIETIKQLANGTWVVVLENGKTFSGINKQDVIDFANEWVENNKQ